MSVERGAALLEGHAPHPGEDGSRPSATAHGAPTRPTILGVDRTLRPRLLASPRPDQANLPRAGEVFRNPDLARTFRALSKGGIDEFYRGDLARKIAAYLESKAPSTGQRDPGEDGAAGGDEPLP